MLQSLLSAREAEYLHSPEQQASEFADVRSPPGPWTPLPMRCPGRENPLLWRSELHSPGRVRGRLYLEVTQDRLTGAILSYRLRCTPAS